ncbi:chromatin modification-like protein isoform X2 [Carex rostrata]
MVREEEQDGVSVHSPSQAPRSSASSLPKVDIELKLLEALEMYPPAKLQGIHRHFVLYGLIEYLQKCFERSFSADEVLQLLSQFFNLEMLKPDEEEMEIFQKEEEFSLPQILLVKEEE